MTTGLELEAEKMARVPGIIFADTAVGGRTARIAGTGLEVFEVIMSYLAVGKDWIQYKECFHWLSDEQLRAAISYYETYTEEIDEEIADNERYTPEYVYSKWPFMKPKEW
jgi:uncharacterized protein (DUF433 family)